MQDALNGCYEFTDNQEEIIRRACEQIKAVVIVRILFLYQNIIV